MSAERGRARTAGFLAVLVVFAAAPRASAQVADVSAPAAVVPAAPAGVAPLGQVSLAPPLTLSALSPLPTVLSLSAPSVPLLAPAAAPAAAATAAVPEPEPAAAAASPAATPAATPAAASASEPAATATPASASAAEAAKTAPLSAPPAVPDMAAMRWVNRFIARIETELAKTAAKPEELSRRSDFDARAGDGEAEPQLRESAALDTEHPHEGWTRVVHFMDEKTIVTGGMDGTIRFLDITSGRLLKELNGHAGVIRALDLSPDKRYLYSADDAGAILRWDLKRGGRPRTLQRPTGQSVRAFRLSPEGHVLATGEHDGTLALWDAVSGRRLQSIALGQTVYDIAYSRGGRYILAAGDDGVIRRVEVQTGAIALFPGHAKGVRALAVRPTDGLLLSAGEDGTIRSWDVETGRETSRYAVADKWVRSIAFAPDGAAIYTGNINGRVDRLEVDPEGRVGKSRTLYTHDDVVFHTALSPAGDFLVSSGRDLRVGIMAADGRLQQLRGSGGPVHAMFVLDDGKLVGVSHDGALLLWENPQDRPRRVEAHAKTARALAVAPNGTVATGGDDKLVLLRRPQRQALELSGHTGRVRALAFSPDQKLLASAGDDRLLLLRDAQTGSVRLRIPLPRSIEVVHALAFSPDGRRLAIAGRDGVVRELDVRKRKLLPAWVQRHKGYIRSLAYRRDGRVLATGGRDGSLWLWDARSRLPLKQLKGHTDDVNSLDFDANGRLLSASDDKTVRLWDPRGPGRVFAGLRPFSSARFTRDGARVLAIDDRQEIASFDAGPGR
jgi:WD40 repeat protein